jgi:hypothetical protein
MEQPIHNTENCWRTKDGEFIPFSEMTNSHLRNAKHFAQAKEEYFWHKSSEMTGLIEKIEAEAERRGISLNDRKSKFQKNNRILKNAVSNL